MTPSGRFSIALDMLLWGCKPVLTYTYSARGSCFHKRRRRRRKSPCPRQIGFQISKWNPGDSRTPSYSVSLILVVVLSCSWCQILIPHAWWCSSRLESKISLILPGLKCQLCLTASGFCKTNFLCRVDLHRNGIIATCPIYFWPDLM